MDTMRLTILGSGSAKPKPHRFQSAQLLEWHNKQFLIDCGEGTQNRLIQEGIRATRLNHIFISHLHGDHCFGLMGLLSTMGMLGRTADIEIHAQRDLEVLLRPMIDFFCGDFPFAIHFRTFNPQATEVIYEDRGITVTTIPLKHHVPTVGFLFAEKPKERHLRREMIEAYGIPVSQLKEIKAGVDFVTPDGQTVPNARLTTPPSPPRRFAYISDTAYCEQIVPMISGADCLYHEVTYMSDNAARAKQTHHSTAAQAATIAKMAGVKQLIVGHYSARYDDVEPLLEEARAIFPNTIGAHDGTKFVIE